jgi:hypothetical protein
MFQVQKSTKINFLFHFLTQKKCLKFSVLYYIILFQACRAKFEQQQTDGDFGRHWRPPESFEAAAGVQQSTGRRRPSPNSASAQPENPPPGSQ